MSTVQPLPEAPALDPLGSAAWLDRYEHAVMGTYGRPQRVLVRGEGAWVWDADGRRYLDLLAGIASNVLGHAHPTLVSAVTAQLSTLGHVSNFFATPPQIALAERLLELLDAPAESAVFFCGSGAEANETALKMARRTGRPRVLATYGAFHGRTMGALALTAKVDYRAPFEPLPGGVEHLPYGDVPALEDALGDDVAALFLEPVQGEGGVVPAPPGYLTATRSLTDRSGALLVLDEVQTGIGRTGAWFAHQRPELGPARPDVVTLAKGLGGGIPVGAAVALGERAATLLGPGQHGTTFGGNPVSAAAALATLQVIERDGLLEHVERIAALLRDGMSWLGHPLVAAVRGVGLLQAIALTRPVARVVADTALDAGFIVNAVAPDAVRLAPPLVLTSEQVALFLEALPPILDAAEMTAP